MHGCRKKMQQEQSGGRLRFSWGSAFSFIGVLPIINEKISYLVYLF
jgi:hypothetical protein